MFGAVRIGPVYTPPEFRGHGYGSALTAAVMQYLRAAGDDVCLFTDLASPPRTRSMPRSGSGRFGTLLLRHFRSEPRKCGGNVVQRFVADWVASNRSLWRKGIRQL
ncbi:GNAT family N-acetyltransferase [Kribbella sp. NPDC049227]|uniref:GNAT family N-acetyltransferase n=1 Tax=Kribbella sp. NPDC049227 TaxID=3364113 RepID=UPI00371BBF49